MNTIDLHGVKHENVRGLLDTFIWDNMKRKSNSVSIITGKSNEMKRIVSEILAEYGISASTQQKVADELSTDKNHWVNFMMKFELGLDEPHPKRAAQSARNIALAYVVGGFIPLSAYFFSSSPNQSLLYSVVITLIALLAFGYFKAKATGQNKWTGAFRTATIGALAAGAAFGIARLIS